VKGAVQLMKNNNDTKKREVKTDPASPHYDEIVRNKATVKSPYGKEEPSTRTEYR
jgi:hypothetical protein